MKQYQDLLQHILDNGVKKDDRTGTGTISVLGYQMRFDLSKGFPLVTTKKVHLKSIIHELLWFLSGSTNVKYLQDNNVRIWNEWADENGELGRIYGAQWRSWRGLKTVDYGTYKIHNVLCSVDQIAQVIEAIKTNPNSRRHIVTAGKIAELELMALPPCHLLFQFYVANGKLSCQLYQRSADCFLGVPFNIASYALLTMMVAKVCDLEVGEFVHTLGDTHIYLNHLEQVKLQLTRKPRPLPTMIIDHANTIDDFTYNHFQLINYDPWPRIKGKVSV